MNPHHVVTEITTHVRGRLEGLPGVTPNAIANLVYGWLRQEQPDVLNQLSSEEIQLVVGEAVKSGA